MTVSRKCFWCTGTTRCWTLCWCCCRKVVFLTSSCRSIITRRWCLWHGFGAKRSNPCSGVVCCSTPWCMWSCRWAFFSKSVVSPWWCPFLQVESYRGEPTHNQTAILGTESDDIPDFHGPFNYLCVSFTKFVALLRAPTPHANFFLVVFGFASCCCWWWWRLW